MLLGFVLGVMATVLLSFVACIVMYLCVRGGAARCIDRLAESDEGEANP